MAYTHDGLIPNFSCWCSISTKANRNANNGVMVNSMSKLSLSFVIYALILLAIFPLIQFEYYKSTPAFDSASPFWVSFRVSYSPLILITCGLVLIFKYTRGHKILGCISVLIGIYYVVIIIKDFG
jgi:uncharacterized Tic20 family protein